MFIPPSNSTNKDQESNDDGFDVDALIKGRGEIVIGGKIYRVFIDDELKNILEHEKTNSENTVTELFKKKWKKVQEYKNSEDVTSITFVYYKNIHNKVSIFSQANAPIEP